MKRRLSDTTREQLEKLEERPAPKPDHEYCDADPVLRGLLGGVTKEDER